MEDFVIDESLRSFLQPISGDEREMLYLAIQRDQRCDEGVVAQIGEQRFLLDGHNRRKICTELGIPFTYRVITLPDHEAALQWIISNQFGRRNMTPEWRRYYIGKEYRFGKRPHGGKSSIRQNDGSIGLDSQRTSDFLAERHGVSPRTVERAAEFSEEVDKLPEEEKQERLKGKGRPAIRCERCIRLNIKTPCKNCHTLRATKKAERNKDTEAKERSGRAEAHVLAAVAGRIDWEGFFADFGLIKVFLDCIIEVRQDQKNTRQHSEAVRLHAALRDHMLLWHNQLVKE